MKVILIIALVCALFAAAANGLALQVLIQHILS